MRNFDNDSDGYDDDLDDFCPGLTGFSSQDRMGCPDSDGDGFSNPDSGWATSDGADAFVGDETQWSDFDGDGYGDNVGGFQPDSCPNQYGTSVNDRFGCLDGDSDGWSTPTQVGGWRQERTRSQRTQHSGRTRMAMASGTARTATTLTIAQMKMAIPLRTGRAASTQMGRVVRPRRVLGNRGRGRRSSAGVHAEARRGRGWVR